MSIVAVTNQTGSVPDTRRVEWIRSLPFFGMHLACLSAFWTGVSWKAVGSLHRFVCRPHVRRHRQATTAIFLTGHTGPAVSFSLCWPGSVAPPPRRGRCGGRRIIGIIISIPTRRRMSIRLRGEGFWWSACRLDSEFQARGHRVRHD